MEKKAYVSYEVQALFESNDKAEIFAGKYERSLISFGSLSVEGNEVLISNVDTGEPIRPDLEKTEEILSEAEANFQVQSSTY